MSGSLAAAAAMSAAPIDEAHERRVALWLTALVLATLTVVKPLGAVPVVGVVGYTVAAALQLYLPLWRADRLGVPAATFGLSLSRWRSELRLVAVVCAVAFPLYALAHHLYMTRMHDWAVGLGMGELARYLPRRVLAPRWPHDAGALAAGALWVGQLAITHTLGVALPEETFYRGYLQPRLETLWPPRHRVLGTELGLAAVAAAALFALGHFLGEWNPLRFGPFFPALAFAWLRRRSGTVTGAIAFHAACNVFGELLFALYRPV